MTSSTSHCCCVPPRLQVEWPHTQPTNQPGEPEPRCWEPQTRHCLVGRVQLPQDKDSKGCLAGETGWAPLQPPLGAEKRPRQGAGCSPVGGLVGGGPGHGRPSHPAQPACLSVCVWGPSQFTEARQLLGIPDAEWKIGTQPSGPGIMPRRAGGQSRVLPGDRS